MTINNRLLWTLTIALVLSCGCGDDDGDDTGHELGIGNRCERDSDCPTNECYLGPAGGYCTSECSHEGSEDECPVDTGCKPIQGGARRCLLICGSTYYCPRDDECDDEWCPEGSSCVNVSDTDAKACEPLPT